MLQNSVTLLDAKKTLRLLYMSFWGATILFKSRNLSFVEQELSTYFPHQARLPEMV